MMDLIHAEDFHQIGGAGNYWDSIGELRFRFGRHVGRYGAGQDSFAISTPIVTSESTSTSSAFIYGVATELSIDEYREERPRFVAFDCFEFYKFQSNPFLG